MRVQEYQAKAFFKKYGLPVLESMVVETPEETLKAVKKLGGSKWAIKAQVLAGGRGEAGGVQLVKTGEEAVQVAKNLLGKSLKTKQTTEAGEVVKKLLVEKACNIEKEFYLSLLVDSKSSQILFLISQEGGVDIEKVAEETPERMHREPIPSFLGLQKYHTWSMAKALGFTDPKEVKKLHVLFTQLYRLFKEKDVSLVEINPLVKTPEGDFVALDGKMTFDENALFRQEDLEALASEEKTDPSEILAEQAGLSLIKLEGNIACMVNGAGLAMATMDLIHFYGGQPANFLDVGGGAEEEKIVKAFEILLKFKNVRAVLVNIFGGIMRCDAIAQGLIKAIEKVGLEIPLVIRLEGTRSQEGLALLKQCGLPLISSQSLDEAAKKVVEVACGNTD